MVVLILFLVCQLCCIGAFFAGILFAKNNVKKAEPIQMTDEEKKKTEKLKKEYENFLKYDGTEQV